ncbi:MAG: tRNA glutamyl-Q(34) synthetase GluQRS [Pseudomonadota bacterium]
MCSAKAEGYRDRFAPSPTGPLHLGHAFSALTAFDAAEAARGTLLVRIEDIDRTRARPEYEAAIFDDLGWLGLRWEAPVLRQSSRGAAYRAALDRLAAEGLIYPCTCSRAEIRAASAPQEGAAAPLYPGTCKAGAQANRPPALRLHMDRAVARMTGPLRFREIGAGPAGETGEIALDPEHLLKSHGDLVLGGRESGTSYHLAVTVDDAAQGISHVTRGEDLFAETPLHVLLQRLLDLPTPTYRHHRLIRDTEGKRLAKRDDARALARFRAEGADPTDIRRMVGL